MSKGMKYYVYAIQRFLPSLHFYIERHSMLSLSMYIDSANQIECKGVVDGCSLTGPEGDEEQEKLNAE